MSLCLRMTEVGTVALDVWAARFYDYLILQLYLPYRTEVDDNLRERYHNKV